MPQSRSRSRKKWWEIPQSTQLVIVAALAVVAVLSVGYLLHTGGKGAPAPTAAAQNGGTSGRQLLFSKIPKNARALFLGDSYTQGYGASKPSLGFAPQTARLLGWRAEVDGVGGTGYTYGGGIDGSAGQDFLTRLKARSKAGRQYDVVVLEGSQNDYRKSRPATQAAMEQAIVIAHKAWPKAAIILFGPTAPLPMGPKLAQQNGLVRQAALNQRVSVIDPVNEKWINASNSKKFQFDTAHLNTAGYAYLAKRLATDIRQLPVPTI